MKYLNSFFYIFALMNMKKKVLLIILVLVLVFGFNSNSFSWGFWAHKKINHQSVFTLPAEMLVFYKNHIDYITKHAIDPDKRRYLNKNENPRHFINPERFHLCCIDSIPRNWYDAVNKYSEDSLKEYGIVPWYINEMVIRLTNAFKERNVDKILKNSADIGHYIADAHVPLHCTENYNGQFTNQVGIHAFWESRIPELFGDKYDFFVGNAKYIKDPMTAIWKVIKESYIASDSVLKFEKQLSNSFPSDKKFSIEKRGRKTIKTYSYEYSSAYSNMLGGMVERRMRASILMVGSLWYTAWVNAGQPDLSIIENKEVSQELINQLKLEDEERQKINNRDNGHTD
jgi:hypothetical protein